MFLIFWRFFYFWGVLKELGSFSGYLRNISARDGIYGCFLREIFDAFQNEFLQWSGSWLHSSVLYDETFKYSLLLDSLATVASYTC